MKPTEFSLPGFLAGGGHAGSMIRAYDWSATSLGPVASWPPSLQSTLGICLMSDLPAAIFWGDELLLFYNDAWSQAFRLNHCTAIGRRVSEVVPALWETIRPAVEKSLTGEAGRLKGIKSPAKNGDTAFFDLAFIPIYGSHGEITGIFNSANTASACVTNEWPARVSPAARGLVHDAAVLKNIKDNKPLQDVYNIFDAVPFALAVLRGDDLHIEFINRYNLNIWQKSRDEVMGKALFDARPDIRASAAAIHEGVYRDRKRFDAREVPIDILIQGEYQCRYFDIIIDPLFDDNGNISGQLATSIDITDQVMARKKIEESERELIGAKRQLELTIENVPAAVYLFDDRGKIMYANKPALQVIKSVLDEDFVPGSDLDSMLKKTAGKIEYRDENNKIIPPELFPTNVALRTGKDAELLLKRVFLNTGKASWFLNRATPLIDEEGRVQLVLSTTTDLTAQKEAEEKIRDSEKRFRTLADALPQMVWMRNIQGEIEFGSKHWEEYSGIKGVTEAWKEMVHPEEWVPVMDAWQKNSQLGRSFQFEARLKNVLGEYRWHHCVVEAMKDANGAVVRWIGAMTDIHAQKTFSENLEKIVADRTLELKRSNEDLQRYAHVASHDLKEPVRKIMIFNDLLKDELGSQVSDKALTYVSKIEKSAIRMFSMINSILIYSSVDGFNRTIELVDLNDLLESIQSDLEITIGAKKAALRFKDLPSIRGSKVLLYQLFYNLVNNALKFSRENPLPVITLHAGIASREELIRTGLDHTKSHQKIVVQDNGIGFDKADEEKIFSSFTRLNALDKYEGTGLGLSLCRKIVELHGGVIQACGKEGEGAAFTVLLPDAEVQKHCFTKPL